MAITYSKPVDKAYLIKQLEAFERYALYDTLKKTEIVTPEAYLAAVSTDPGALLIIADGVTPASNEINLSTVDAVTPGFNVGDYVTHQAEVTKVVDYYRHRYRKLSETYAYIVNYQYYVGNLVTHDGCLYAAVVDNMDAAWDESHWSMVGAKSILQIVEDALPDTSDLKEDMVFVLKNDEMDATVIPSVVKHAHGIWIYDKESDTYTQYHEYETTALDFAEVWDSTKTATYKGNADKVATSKFVYESIKTFGDKVVDEIKDLYDIVGQPEYIILATKADLDAYDLTTLPDNSVAMFMIRTDETQPIPGTTPVEYYSTLYVCVCDDDSTPRKTDYVGHLQYGEKGLDTLIEEAINKALHEMVPAHYEKDTTGSSEALTVVADGTIAGQIELADVTPTTGSFTPSVGVTTDATTAYQSGTTLTVVADGTTPLAANEVELSTANGALVDGQAAVVVGDTVDLVTAYTAGTILTIVADGTIAKEIELSNVNPVLSGYTPAVGDQVILKPESLATEYKFILRSEVDDETLQKISHQEVTYVDPDDPTSTETVDYLTYNSKQIMPRDFETKNIDFADSSEYEPVVEG